MRNSPSLSCVAHEATDLVFQSAKQRLVDFQAKKLVFTEWDWKGCYFFGRDGILAVQLVQ